MVKRSVNGYQPGHLLGWKHHGELEAVFTEALKLLEAIAAGSNGATALLISLRTGSDKNFARANSLSAPLTVAANQPSQMVLRCRSNVLLLTRASPVEFAACFRLVNGSCETEQHGFGTNHVR